MDLLGDLGATDQLTAARAENEVLREKVKQLSSRVQVLTVENESLKAEVEIYRNEKAAAQFSKLSLRDDDDEKMHIDDDSSPTTAAEEASSDAFVRSGNGVYPAVGEMTLNKLHVNSNPLCCALSPNNVILATGGADFHISLCAWESMNNGISSSSGGIDPVPEGSRCRLRADAPVICIAFATSSSLRGVLAAGCMDGSLYLVQYKQQAGCLPGGIRAKLVPLSSSSNSTEESSSPGPAAQEFKHGKYVRNVAWSPSDPPVLATCSADGTVQVFRVTSSLGLGSSSDDNDDFSRLQVVKLETLHLGGPVEALCISSNHRVICHARGSPYLHFFDVDDDFKQTKINMNTTTAGDEHVSFVAMDLKLYRNKYLAIATDASRNIIMDVSTGKQIRNLYGHSHDGYSQPKVAWSDNGQYLLGNTADESVVVVWDIAGGKIVDKLRGHHSSPIRDLYCASSNGNSAASLAYSSDYLVTTAFDKMTTIWCPRSDEQ